MCTWHAAACSCRQGHETQHAQWGEGLPRKLPAAHRRASVGRSPPQAAMAGHTTADSEEEAWGKTEAAHLCNNERPAAGPSAANSQPHSCPSGHPTRARAHHPLGATFPDALPPLWRRAYRPLMCHIVRSSPPPPRLPPPGASRPSPACGTDSPTAPAHTAPQCSRAPASGGPRPRRASPPAPPAGGHTTGGGSAPAESTRGGRHSGPPPGGQCSGR